MSLCWSETTSLRIEVQQPVVTRQPCASQYMEEEGFSMNQLQDARTFSNVPFFCLRGGSSTADEEPILSKDTDDHNRTETPTNHTAIADANNETESKERVVIDAIETTTQSTSQQEPNGDTTNGFENDDDSVSSQGTPDYTMEEDVALLHASDSTESDSPNPRSTDTTTASATDNDSDKFAMAAQLRLKGKDCHDEADFAQAALFFQQAADTLTDTTTATDHGTTSWAEEYATCRLHQALCHLKCHQYSECVEACTNLLVPEEASTSEWMPYSPAVRARAYHRRAKAKLGLQDPSGALADARSAAFLGDRKAVALYGKLMRESTLSTPSLSSSSSSSSSALESLFSSSGSPSPTSNSLLESLLNKSTGSSSSSSSSSSSLGDFSPLSMLLSNKLLGNNKQGMGGTGTTGGLAKSVLQSLSKRIEEESTQETICQYLSQTNAVQFQQLATMAGLGNQLSSGQVNKIVDFCHGVTPKTIQKTVRHTKRAIWVFQLIRRVVQVIQKYKSFLIALVLLQWTKSAMMRPIPINRRAAKQALKQAMKANRRGGGGVGGIPTAAGRGGLGKK